MAVAQLGIVLTPGVGVVLWALMLGFAAALSFIVVLTLPPRLAAAGDVHRMSAAIFTVQYAVAFVLPLIASALWDATGLAVLAFAPGVAATAAMAWLVLPCGFPRISALGQSLSNRSNSLPRKPAAFRSPRALAPGDQCEPRGGLVVQAPR